GSAPAVFILALTLASAMPRRPVNLKRRYLLKFCGIALAIFLIFKTVDTYKRFSISNIEETTSHCQEYPENWRVCLAAIEYNLRTYNYDKASALLLAELHRHPFNIFAYRYWGTLKTIKGEFQT